MPMPSKLIATVVGVTALAVAAPSSADAATGSAPIAVTATVLSSAIVLATPMVFGNYDPAPAAGNTTSDVATSTVTVTATAGTPYVVGIDKGLGAGATIANRKLTNSLSADTLSYSVYRDAAHTNLWGVTSGTDTVAGTGSGLAQVLTAYGQIPTGQRPATGAYLDTLTVTVTY